MFEYVTIAFGNTAHDTKFLYVYDSMQQLFELNNVNLNVLNDILQIPDDAWLDEETTVMLVPRLHVFTTSYVLSIDELKRMSFAKNIANENVYIHEKFVETWN